jgi:hypothetical protein
MEQILEEIIFNENKNIFKHVKPDYLKKGILEETKQYINLNKVIIHLLFYKNRPKNLKLNEIKKDIIIDDNIEYINYQGIIKLLIKRSNDYRVCDLHIKLGLAKEKNIQGLTFIEPINEDIEYTLQTIFTFTIFKYLTIKHDISIIAEYEIEEIPYRCDIILEKLDIILEFYENWHINQKKKDGLRQEHIQGLGYEILVFNEKESNIREFIIELDSIIINRKLLHDENKEDEYIINVLVSGGCNKKIAAEMYEIYKIGNDCKININKCLLSLGYSSFEKDKAISKAIEILEINNYVEDEENFYLNSYGYKYLLLCLDNTISDSYKKYYIELENICIRTLKNTRSYLIKNNKNIRKTTGKLLEYARNNADKELIKENSELKNKIEYLEKLNKDYENANRYIFKRKLEKIEKDKELEEGDIILSQIPELQFTNDINALVSVQNIKLKLQVNNITLRTKDRISFSKAIDYIKKKLGVDKIPLYNNNIPHCKLVVVTNNRLFFDNNEKSDIELDLIKEDNIDGDIKKFEK